MGEASYKAMRAAEMDDVIFSGNTGRPARNHAEVAVLDRQRRPQGAGGLQRNRHARSLAPHHARARLDLPRQRPRGARARRHHAVRRRLDRLALAGARASGPHRRDHPGAAGSAPPRARRSRRHFRTACAPARGGTAAQGRRAQSRRASKTSSASSPPRSPRSRPRRGRRCAIAISPARCGAPRRCCCICAGSPPARNRRGRAHQGRSRPRRRRRAPASRRRPPPGRPKSPPGSRPCARPKPGPRRRCSVSLIAREALEREEARAKERIGELDRRLEQYAADLQRERTLAADAAAALARLDAEEADAQGRSAGERRAA